MLQKYGIQQPAFSGYGTLYRYYVGLKVVFWTGQGRELIHNVILQ